MHFSALDESEVVTEMYKLFRKCFIIFLAEVFAEFLD